MDDLSGKVALITGASSGIGAATALLFARRGAKLSLSGRNEVDLQRVGDECARAGTERPLVVVAELSCEPDVANLVDATVKKFGRLDILVNNAGILDLGSIETTLAGAVRSRDGRQRAGGVPTHDAVRSASDRDARQHRQRVEYRRNATGSRSSCLLHVQVRRGPDDRLRGTGAGLEGRASEQRQPGSDCDRASLARWDVG